MTQTIWIIGVNYNNDEETVKFCAGAVRQVGGFELLLVVVDNSWSAKQACDRLDSRLRGVPRTNVLNPPENLGYFGGANWALETLLKSGTLADWVIVCNTDITLIDPDFCQKLVQLDGMERADVLAPSICSDLSGKDQNPLLRLRPAAFSVHLEKWILRYSASRAFACWISATKSKVKGAVETRRHATRKRIEGIDIYAPHGSFIIFASTYFKRGGSLRHGTFLYAEEILVAETAIKLELRIRFVPALKLRHAQHASVRASPNRGRYQAAASAYCADHFFPLFRRNS
jgi:GT2 family glycosyltransferase